ncbi:unnamed protein product, partial [Oikopleura dioica]
GNFPLGHKGKIIFIERDTPAVVVSAYHFMKKLPFLHAYLKQHDIFDDLQKFARFMFEGKHFFGMPQDYNKEWKAFAKEHPELKIEFFKFEEIIADKPKEISRLLKFLEIENAHLAKIVEDSDIKKAKEHRQKEAEKTGEPFVEGIIFRKGNSKGWKEELSEETIAFYESFSN